MESSDASSKAGKVFAVLPTCAAEGFRALFRVLAVVCIDAELITGELESK
jgi:hypothetical protein